MDIERLWLPVLQRLGLYDSWQSHTDKIHRHPRTHQDLLESDEDENFPRWLHLLVPAE